MDTFAATKRFPHLSYHDLEVELSALSRQISLLYPPPSFHLWGCGIELKQGASSTASGDYFGFIPCPDGRVLVILLDATGNGSLAAAQVRNICSILGDKTITDSASPAELIRIVNRRLFSDVVLRTDEGLQMSVLSLDTNKGELNYSNAGMPSAVLLRASNNYDADQTWIERVADSGSATMGTLLSCKPTNVRRTLRPGDVLCLASDGIVESRNSNDEIFTLKRLTERAAYWARPENRGNQSIPDLIEQDIRTFCSSPHRQYDETLATIEFRSQCRASERLQLRIPSKKRDSFDRFLHDSYSSRVVTFLRSHQIAMAVISNTWTASFELIMNAYCYGVFYEPGERLEFSLTLLPNTIEIAVTQPIPWEPDYRALILGRKSKVPIEGLDLVRGSGVVGSLRLLNFGRTTVLDISRKPDAQTQL